MPRRAPPTGKIASVSDRIIGAICFVLMVASFAVGGYTHDAQTQLFCCITAILYLMTAIGLATDNGVD